MKTPVTLYSYLSKHFIYNLILIILVVITVLTLASTVEVLRIIKDRDYDFILFIKLVFYKLPFLLEKVIPFIILLNSMSVFYKLARSNELTVLKSFGMSVWNLIAPLIFISFILGIFIITIFNPLSSYFLGRFENMINNDILKSNRNFAIDFNGIWLRENNFKNNYILYAKIIDEEKRKLQDVTCYIFDDKGKFNYRIDASEIDFSNNEGIFKNPRILFYNQNITTEKSLNIPIFVNFDRIKDNIISPETIGFWQILKFINLFKQAGISNIKYKIYFYKICILPIYMVAMVIIASLFSLQSHLRKNDKLLLILGLACGFVIYFFLNFISELGLSGILPMSIAVMIPIFIILLVSTAILTQIENG